MVERYQKPKMSYEVTRKNQTLDGFEVTKSDYYCKEHNTNHPKISPGGSYCYYHHKELCTLMHKHCKVCGVWLETMREFVERVKDQ